MFETIVYIAIIVIVFCLSKIFKDTSFFIFIRKKRGILLVAFSVIVLLGTLVANNFKFKQIFPSLTIILMLFLLVGLFYIYKDHPNK